jgi:hypothetical protein
MTNINEEIKRALNWKTRDEERWFNIRWDHRPEKVIRFHNQIRENLERMSIVANAGKIDYITSLGGFRIYLIEDMNIPSYCEDFTGKYSACEEYYHFRRYQESLVPTMFRALRGRENLEPTISRKNSEEAIKELTEISSKPFNLTDIPNIVLNIDEIRERTLGIKRLNFY